MFGVFRVMNCICMCCCIISGTIYGFPFVSTYVAIRAKELYIKFVKASM